MTKPCTNYREYGYRCTLKKGHTGNCTGEYELGINGHVVSNCTCGSGGHPRKCATHPWAYKQYCLELEIEQLNYKILDLKYEIRQLENKIERVE